MKIAVCISGRMSGFDVTSKLFEHWNSIYDNVEFYFFISTWKDVSSEYSETRGPVEDWDFSKYKFITKTFLRLKKSFMKELFNTARLPVFK